MSFRGLLFRRRTLHRVSMSIGRLDNSGSSSETAVPPTRAKNAIVLLAPGLALCAVGTLATMTVNTFLPAVSSLLIAIVLGAVLTNAVTLPRKVQPGLKFSAKRLLRIGVALLGLQLMLSDILGLGWGIIVVVIAIVALGIFGTMFVGKLLGLSWTQRLLIACGFSICGAVAVAAVDGVLGAEGEREEEVVTAVALVVIFGTLMIPTIPLLASTFGLSDLDAGMWAGGSIHEVAQVIAAGGAIGGAALGVAAVVKLARVLMLAPVMAVLSVRQRRILGPDADVKRPPLIPFFVVAFLVCVGMRSVGVLPTEVLDYAHVAQTTLLNAAMFALGAGVHLSTVKKVGVRPFILAAISTAWVAAIALTGVLLAG